MLLVSAERPFAFVISCEPSRLMFSVMASSKVEPADPYSWEDDNPAAPNLLKYSPPSSPTTPLLSKDVVKPSNGFAALKLGYPFKGSLKKPSSQGTYVAPGFEENNESLNTSNCAGEGPDCTQQQKKRSISWLDNHGKELIEVKEFEPSESEDSDDDDQDHCFCSIQ